MPVTQDQPAPYTSPSVVIEVVARYRDKGLPTPVTPEVLARAGVSESLIPRSLQSLKGLDLIDAEGRPTAVLEGLRLAPEGEYRARVADWLNAAYADALQFIDPATSDETAIHDAFRSYKPTGQRDRMVTLFCGLFSHAGIGPERAKAAPRKNPPPRGKPITAMAKPATVRAFQNPPPPPLLAPAGLHPALAGLLASLPPTGEGWTKVERDRFLATFGAVLDFCFPVVTAKSKPPQAESEGEPM